MHNELLNLHLKTNLLKTLPKHSIAEAYTYAVLPAGKLFRPGLVFSIVEDLGDQAEINSLNKSDSSHSLLACALEIHHAYTLVHDDLPCMDDDDMRRGKASVHKKYGEWQAVLIGDGLLNASYQLIGKINHPALSFLMKLIPWATGPKGLIHGQVLDLSHEINLDFNSLRKTHLNKTARLIQLAMTGSYSLLEGAHFKTGKEIFRLGESMGLIFQYIDDLSELIEEQISQHEKDINPWLKYNEKLSQEIKFHSKRISTLLNTLELVNTKKLIKVYIDKMSKNINDHKEIVLMHLKNRDLEEILFQIKSICD